LTPFAAYSSLKACEAGISPLQGPHQLAQKSMYVTLLLLVISLKSTTLLLASSKEVGVKATAGMVDTLSVEVVSAGFFEEHFENSTAEARANNMRFFFMIFDLG